MYWLYFISLDLFIKVSLQCNYTNTFTFSHFVDAFIQSDLQLGNT